MTRPARVACIVVLLLGATVPARPDAVELMPVPEPAFEGLEPPVRAQLDAARAALDAAATADPAERAGAFADLGQLYLLYERPASALPAFENSLRLAPDDLESTYYLGVLHQDAGRFADAATAFEHVLDRVADDAPLDLATPARLRLGEVLLRLRRLDEAERAFARAVAIDPSTAAGHYGLGRVARERREWRAAVEHFERALALQPDADAVHHPLGLAHRQLGDLDAARAALERAGGSVPTFADAPMRRLLDRSASARSHLIDGNRARRRGLHELALASYRRAVAVDPSNAQAHYNLGALLGELGRVEEAEAAFRAALDQDPGHRDSHFNLAVGLRARGRHAEAAEHFAAALAADPADHAARLELGVTLAAAGRRAEGRAELDAVRAAEPRDPAVLLQLARYLDALGDPAAAEAVLERTWEVAVDPLDRARVRLRQAEGALRRADRRLAGHHFDEAVALAPDLVEARLARAAFLDRAGRYPDAAADYAAAETLAPQNAAATVGRALALCRTGRFAEARDALAAGLDRQGEPPEGIDALARLLATAPDPAIRDGERALALAERLAAAHAGPRASETRAMALAAVGRFDDAAAVQRQLLSGVGPRAPAALAGRLRANLGRYQDGRIALPPW